MVRPNNIIRRAPSGHRVGQDHPRAKLTDAEVAAMRAEYLPYVRGYGYLARKWGCSPSTVRDIVTYRTRML